MAKEVELRRHTDNDGDVLTPDGVASAVEIGRRLRGGYRFVASSGAQRATQTTACFLGGLGEPVPGGAIIEEGLRSQREDEWRAAYRKAGKGDLASLRAADPDLFAEDSDALATGLLHVFDRLEDGERALAVGHSPTSEAAVFGLTGQMVGPLAKGEGVLVVLDDGEFTVTRSP
jgi:broad specificity phosphatase PhoE